MNYGLIGEALSHSLSPLIHRCFGNEDYGLFPLAREQLADFLETGAFSVLNVTVPYKEKVIPFCDELSVTALTCGNVNTLLKRQDGTVYGDNTDYGGMKALCAKNGISLTHRFVVILGSGGAAKTAQALCEAENATECILISRSLGASFGSYQDKELFRSAEIIINATPVGMYPRSDATPLDISLLEHTEAVIDLIYNPLPTRFLREAAARDIKTADGLWLLIEQARLSEELFQNKSIDPAINAAAFREAVATLRSTP